MSGAEVFAMDPDEVHNAVEVLFDIESTVEQATSRICEESTVVTENFKQHGTALGPALEAAVEWWKVYRAGGFERLVGNCGEYLATCAEEAVEIDEYNAGRFASYADHDRYPGRDSEHASARPDW
jgi:hypothetical protein